MSSIPHASTARESPGYVTTNANTSTASPRVGSSVPSSVDKGRAIPTVANTEKKTEEKKEVSAGSPVIPRLTGCPSISEMDEVDPRQWKSIHVKKFLEINDCGPYCEAFSSHVSNC